VLNIETSISAPFVVHLRCRRVGVGYQPATEIIVGSPNGLRGRVEALEHMAHRAC
jgi:hypothetical protein